MLDFELMKYCYGCGACVNACPRSAIQMVQTMDGSCIPKIDQAQCINCGKCDQVCIHQHTDRYHSIIAGEGCYAAYELDKVERKESASGGMFFVLAKEVLRQDGYVCGCVWNEKMDAVHIVSNKTIDIERMRNSKYVQSDIGRCLAEIRELLKTGKNSYVLRNALSMCRLPSSYWKSGKFIKGIFDLRRYTYAWCLEKIP